MVSHHTNKTYKLKQRLRPALYKDCTVFKDLKVSEMVFQVMGLHYFTREAKTSNISFRLVPLRFLVFALILNRSLSSRDHL